MQGLSTPVRSTRLGGYDNYPVSGRSPRLRRRCSHLALQGPSLFGEGFRTPEAPLSTSVAQVDELPGVSVLDGAAGPLGGTDVSAHVRSPFTPAPATPALGADDGSCWVTVFGFPPSRTAAVVEALLACGQIVSHHTDTANANWVHVEFEVGGGRQPRLLRLMVTPPSPDSHWSAAGADQGWHCVWPQRYPQPSVFRRPTHPLGAGTMMLGVRRRASRPPTAATPGSRLTPSTRASAAKSPFHSQPLYLQERSAFAVPGASGTSAPVVSASSWWGRATYYLLGW